MTISAIRMPKWGLSMTQGLVGPWLVTVGSSLNVGDELFEVETDKIANAVPALSAGVLRRIVAAEGTTQAVGALLGVIADEDVSDAEIDQFVAREGGFSGQPDSVDAVPDAKTLRSEHVSVGGHSLRIARSGDMGTAPLVLIHGFAGNIDNWQFVIPALVEQFDVIAIDLPGHGLSTRQVSDGSVSFMASLVAGVLSELKVDRYHLVGHSLGASVAFTVAARRRESALSLTLICPPGFGGTAVDPEFIRGIVNSTRNRDLKRWMERLVSDPSLVSRAMVDDMLKYKRLDGVTEALTTIGDRLVSERDRQVISSALSESHRTLIIASANDQVVGTLDEANLPDAIEVQLVPNVGHMPHLEAPALVVKLIKQHVGGA